ncbi:partial leader peptidase (prepilin peptidase) / N-methyltransferase, partial [uncultured bacterium]
CRKPISARYPIVESIVATLFAIAVWRGMVQGGPVVTADWHAWLTTLTMLVSIGILIPLALIDLDLTIIPDELSIYPLLFFVPMAAHVAHLQQGLDPALTNALLFSRLPLWLNGVCSALVAGAAGAGALWLIGKMGNVLFREKAKAMGGETMGFGDVKLLALLGVMLGWPKLVMAFAIAVVLGALIGLALRFSSRRLFVPFGPFLVAGALAAMLLPSELMGLVEWYLRLITPGNP